MNKHLLQFVALLPPSLAWCCLCSAVLSIALCPEVFAQANRSAWMWSSPSHPFGAANVIGNEAKQRELISNFDYWGFDRIYTSIGNMPSNSIASWNTTLDNTNIASETLYGLIDFSPTQMAALVQTRLINFNNSRVDPRERFDAVHLDLEPHARSGWSSATPAEKHAILLELRDTFAAVRAQLDNNGCEYVRVYADLPVWFDSLTSNLGWANAADRDQWFDDLGLALDGISLMAYERSTLSSIISGVGWEVANFDGEVRIGLNVAEIGPGQTFASFDQLMEMAESIEAYYGTNIGGVDFHAVTSFSDLAASRLPGDYNGDGIVDTADYVVWRYNVGSTTSVVADGNFDGIVGVTDLDLWVSNYGPAGDGNSSPADSMAIPEPVSFVVCLAGMAAMLAWPIRRDRNALRI